MTGRGRRCGFVKADGGLCTAWSTHDDERCFRHSEKHREEAAEASRLGGLHRRKEAITAEVYDFGDFGTPEDVLRLLTVAALELLSLQNTVPRDRTLAYVCDVALRAFDTHVVHRRLAALEQALGLLPDGTS